MTARNDRPKLVMPKNEARRRLQKRIEAAKDILPTDIHSHDDLAGAERRERGWRAYNDELLSRMFTTEEYRDDYTAAVRRVHTVEDRYFPVSLQKLVGRLSDSVQSQVARLHSLVERLDLIDELSPATNNQAAGSPLLQGKALIEEARRLGLAVNDLLTADGQGVAYEAAKDFRATTALVLGEWRKGDRIRDQHIIDALRKGRCPDIISLEYLLQQRVAAALAEERHQPQIGPDRADQSIQANAFALLKAIDRATQGSAASVVLDELRDLPMTASEAQAAFHYLKRRGWIEANFGVFYAARLSAAGHVAITAAENAAALTRQEQPCSPAPTEKPSELLTLKPGIWGMSIDLKEAVRRICRRFQRGKGQ